MQSPLSQEDKTEEFLRNWTARKRDANPQNSQLVLAIKRRKMIKTKLDKVQDRYKKLCDKADEHGWNLFELGENQIIIEEQLTLFINEERELSSMAVNDVRTQHRRRARFIVLALYLLESWNKRVTFHMGIEKYLEGYYNEKSGKLILDIEYYSDKYKYFCYKVSRLFNERKLQEMLALSKKQEQNLVKMLKATEELTALRNEAKKLTTREKECVEEMERIKEMMSQCEVEFKKLGEKIENGNGNIEQLKDQQRELQSKIQEQMARHTELKKEKQEIRDKLETLRSEAIERRGRYNNIVNSLNFFSRTYQLEID